MVRRFELGVMTHVVQCDNAKVGNLLPGMLGDV
jgi:hypothetical protein